jgi:alpha-aminoadipic semialdehyde synthase
VTEKEIGPLDGEEPKGILGIKEMPEDFFQAGKVYLFFSHTIKGQSHNMPMLARILDEDATLLDYELIVDDEGRRLVYFGNWAGMAGISDTFRVLGKRLEIDNIRPNPFQEMKPTLQSKGVSGIETTFANLAKRIQEYGLPKELAPFVVGFAGYGNVSKGAQKIFDILPHEVVSPDDLPSLPARTDVLYKCVFKEKDMVAPNDDNAEFELQDYYTHGLEKYHGIFHEHAKHLTVLMNCIYWSPKYPRLLTKDFIENQWSRTKHRLIVIGDISCDIEGAIEFTVKCTKPDKPAFTYNTKTKKADPGITTNGPVIMAVDNLPCELPIESSTSFSETLLDFVPTLAKTDFNIDFHTLDLCRELKDAIIVYQGSLTEQYTHLNKYLNR